MPVSEEMHSGPYCSMSPFIFCAMQIIGFVPADAFPLAAAPGADALFGIEESVWVIHLFNDTHALDTAPAMVQRSLFGGTHLNDSAVVHTDIVEAAAVAATAGGFVDGHFMLLSLQRAFPDGKARAC